MRLRQKLLAEHPRQEVLTKYPNQKVLGCDFRPKLLAEDPFTEDPKQKALGRRSSTECRGQHALTEGSRQNVVDNDLRQKLQQKNRSFPLVPIRRS